VSAVFEVRVLALDQTQPGFVNHSRALQRGRASLAAALPPGDAAQFRVCHLNQPVEGRWLPRLPFMEQRSYAELGFLAWLQLGTFQKMYSLGT
jgi:hypothetical protein